MWQLSIYFVFSFRCRFKIYELASDFISNLPTTRFNESPVKIKKKLSEHSQHHCVFCPFSFWNFRRHRSFFQINVRSISIAYLFPHLLCPYYGKEGKGWNKLEEVRWRWGEIREEVRWGWGEEGKSYGGEEGKRYGEVGGKEWKRYGGVGKKGRGGYEVYGGHFWTGSNRFCVFASIGPVLPSSGISRFVKF